MSYEGSIKIDITPEATVRGYYEGNMFIIYDFGCDPMYQGHGRKALVTLRDTLIDKELIVRDFTPMALPFWLKMLKENIIRGILWQETIIRSLSQPEMLQVWEHCTIHMRSGNYFPYKGELVAWPLFVQLSGLYLF